MNVLVFNIWLPWGEKVKNKGWKWEEKPGEWHQSFKSLEATSTGGGGACKNWVVQKRGARMAAHLCLHLCDQKEQSVIRAQVPNIWKTEYFCPPWLSQTMCKLLQEHVESWWLQVGDKWLLLCGELSWNWPKLTVIYLPSSPGSCNPSTDSRVLK